MPSRRCLNDTIDHLIHKVDIVREGAVLPLPQQALQRQPPQLRHRGAQRIDHRAHEWMVGFAIERVETIIEAANADRIQRQRGHVMSDIDFVFAVEPIPFSR